MLVVAASSFGVMFWLQNRMAAPPTVFPGVRGTFARSGPQYLLPQEQDALVEQVKGLRAKWRPWALLHKDELRQMLHASDQQAQKQVYYDLPSNLPAEGTGLSTKDLAAPFMFTWNPGTKEHKAHPQHSADPRAEHFLQAEIVLADKRLDEDFATHKDIQIALSVNIGKSHYVLWASGRVTEVSIQPQGGAAVWAHREIKPPYDFLVGGSR